MRSRTTATPFDGAPGSRTYVSIGSLLPWTATASRCAVAWPAAGADTPGARHTSVADAVADLEACVAAKIFKGTELSSFSDAVLHLRRARGVAHDGDSHRIRKLGGKFPDDTDYSVPYRET